nr:hypothetical protein CFP56_56775 [Quercus suber]
MVDFTFDIELHVGGCFVEEPTLEYVGGSVHTLTEIDPDKLSFFEIRDLCHLAGAPKEGSRYRYGALVVEYPNGGRVADDVVGGDVAGDVAGVGGDAVRDEIDLKNDYDEEKVVEIGARDEEQDVEVSARVEEQNVEGDDDWQNEGLEGDDFSDDIFAAQNSAPQGLAPNTALESSNAPHTAPESSNAM